VSCGKKREIFPVYGGEVMLICFILDCHQGTGTSALETLATPEIRNQTQTSANLQISKFEPATFVPAKPMKSESHLRKPAP